MSIVHVHKDHKKLLDEIQTTLNKAKRIVAITGAGISTNCGIPDFRSKEGLYNLIDSELKSRPGSRNVSSGSLKGKDLFSSTVWQDENSTAVFYSFIASLRQKIRSEVKSTSQTHKFIRRIRDQKKLLRCYTQNIDGLESRDGLSLDHSHGVGNRSRFTKQSMALPMHEQHNVSMGKLDGGCEVVQLHGELETVRCTICQTCQPWTRTEHASFLRGEAPSCSACELESVIRQAAGKRSTAIGTLRPNIVLYGESNPKEAEIGKLLAHDLTFGPDLLLIMGTSLQVHGLKTIVKEFAKAVHSKKSGKVIFINLSEPARSTWKDVIDYWVDMDCDEWSKDKFRNRQTELGFAKTMGKSAAGKSAVGKSAAGKSTAPPTSIRYGEKENTAATPEHHHTSKQPNPPTLPTPPASRKRKRALAELDPVSATKRQGDANRAGTVSETLLTPSSHGKRSRGQDFEIWEAEDSAATADVATIVLQSDCVGSPDASPLRGRKRRAL